MCRISLLTCRTTKKTYRVWNKIVRTQKKSQAHIFDSCRLRNSRHPGDGHRLWPGRMYLATVRAETSNPNLASSAWNSFLTPEPVLNSHLSDEGLKVLGNRPSTNPPVLAI